MPSYLQKNRVKSEDRGRTCPRTCFISPNQQQTTSVHVNIVKSSEASLHV